jgi:VIT1/CCC1 family predicted Fe2+/Mn2+ transporter
MLPVSNMRRKRPVKRSFSSGFLESLIDPIDWLSETTFSLLIFLSFTLAFWLGGLSGALPMSISPDEVNEFLVAALGASLAWGIIDGILYLLFTVFEQGGRRRLLEDVQAAGTNEEALEIIAEDMDYLLEPIIDREDRGALYGIILPYLQKGKPHNIGLKREDITVLLGHAGVAIMAVIPSAIPFLVLRNDFALALRISTIVSFVMLFTAGFRWGRYTGVSPWKTGLLLTSVMAVIVVLIVLLGG